MSLAVMEPAVLALLRETEPVPVTEASMVGVFKPGDEVPKSGIYKVVHGAAASGAGPHGAPHAPPHAEEHEVTCLKGEQFPACHGCGHHVRFALVRSAHHVRSHEHFKR